MVKQKTSALCVYFFYFFQDLKKNVQILHPPEMPDWIFERKNSQPPSPPKTSRPALPCYIFLFVILIFLLRLFCIKDSYSEDKIDQSFNKSIGQTTHSPPHAIIFQN